MEQLHCHCQTWTQRHTGIKLKFTWKVSILRLSNRGLLYMLLDLYAAFRPLAITQWRLKAAFATLHDVQNAASSCQMQQGVSVPSPIWFSSGPTSWAPNSQCMTTAEIPPKTLGNSWKRATCDRNWLPSAMWAIERDAYSHNSRSVRWKY